MMEYKKIKVFAKAPKSEHPVVFEGFPGIGLVGNIASQHIINELEMDYLGSINSLYFPPIAVLFEGIINMPVRIYESPDNEIVTIVSDIPIHPSVSYEVGMELVDWIESINISEVVSIAGIATMSPENRVFGAATTEEMLEKIKGIVEIFQVGTISGISGTILAECSIRNIPAISLLGETHSQNPDPRAAAAVIKVINTLYNLSIDTEKLIEQGERIELELQRLAEQVKSTEIEPQKKEVPMYG
ncbi:MAG: proteasome assembly chaperone family protein [Methanosarcinales archaeon]